MSSGKDDPKTKGAERSPSATVGGDADGTAKRSGRVAYDSRGNPIWEWQLETGVYSRDVTTQKLKKLDLGELSIADTAIQKGPTGLQNPSPRSPEQGFNPYDNSTKSTPTSNRYEKGRATGDQSKVGFAPAKKPTPTAAKAPARTPTDLRKLSDWIKLKRSTQNKKDD